MKRIAAMSRQSTDPALAEEIPPDQVLNENNVILPRVMKRSRIELHQRHSDIAGVIEYNLLERKKDDKRLLDWKSYPGISNIITEARKLTEEGQVTDIEMLLTLMLVHESQQSAPIVASIAILIGKN